MGNRPNRMFGPVRLALAMVLTMLLAPAAAQGAILYDSTPSFGGVHPTIQDFETSLNQNDAIAADDFTVPAGQTWTLTRALIDGRDPGDSGPGTTDVVNVRMYNSNGTLPQEPPFYEELLLVSEGNVFPDFNVALPNGPVLGAGTYWFGGQAVMDLDGATNNYWVWGAVGTQRGNMAAYKNPGNGFGSGCTTFAIMQNCVTGVAKPDMSFRLEGTCAGCPVPPATTPVTPAPTKKKKCKKKKKGKAGAAAKCKKKKKKK